MPPHERAKEIILFIHGFGSSPRCWSGMLDLIRDDERVSSRYDTATWQYPTKWVELNLLGRIPRLKELGRALADEIDSPRYQDRLLTLVGHSQGGLVIQSYFAELLHRGEASKLRDVRQAVFFATPSEGSTTGMSLRLLATTFFRNPQEATLRVLNPDVADMRAVIRERVVAATADSDVAWRVPIHAFSGLQDDIVPEASARGPFDDVKRVPGNHFTILRPKDRDDPRYAEFVELLLDPGGHVHRFEIEKHDTSIRVEPRVRQSIQFDGTRTPREVEFDNYCRQLRTVRFALRNRCHSPFTIRYGTRSDGYIVGHTSHPNEVPPAEKGRWEDTGTYYQFDFTPRSGEDYCLEVEIYKGFDAGERDVHFHLGNHSWYRRMTYVLDLSAYVSAGYTVSQGPHLHFFPEDHEHGELCSTRRLTEPIEVSEQRPEGIFRWELGDVRKGIVDIIWDVAPPRDDTAAGARDA